MEDINFTSGHAPRLRLERNGSPGIDVDFFDEQDGKHLAGRYLNEKDVKDLVQFLAPSEVRNASVKVNDIINGFPEPQGVHKWAQNLRVTDIDFPLGPEGKGVRAVNERGTVYAFKYDEFEIVARAEVPAATTERVNATWSGFKVGDTVVEIVNGGTDVIVKREGEATTTERVSIELREDLRVGDVIVENDMAKMGPVVDRQVPVRPAEPEFGHGTAYVFGMTHRDIPQERYRGFLSKSGHFYFLSPQGDQRSAYPSQHEDFRLED